MSKKFNIIYYFLVAFIMLVFSYQIYLLLDIIFENPNQETVDYIVSED